VRITHVFTIAAFVALVACQNTDMNKKDSNTSKNTHKQTDSKAYKFAFVNSDTLLEKYSYYKEMKKDLETKGRIIDADLRNRASTFQNEVVLFQKSVGSMTIDQGKNTEQLLAAKEQELGRYKQTVENDYLKDEQDRSKKLNNNINEFIKKYAEENGYTFIFSYSKNATGVGLLYGQDALNITEDVVKKMNDEYKPEKKDK